MEKVNYNGFSWLLCSFSLIIIIAITTAILDHKSEQKKTNALAEFCAYLILIFSSYKIAIKIHKKALIRKQNLEKNDK